jgi:hypothetical protein
MPPYTRRRLHVRDGFDSEAVLFVIRDEGCGFNTDKLPLPTDPDGLELGSGLVLNRTLMDEVAFNFTANQIILSTRRENRGCSTPPGGIS